MTCADRALHVCAAVMLNFFLTMHISKTTLRAIAGTLLIAFAFSVSIAGAKSIDDFERMTPDDQGRYFDQLIVKTVAYFRSKGRDSDAEKLDTYFRYRGREAAMKFSDYIDDVKAASLINRNTGEVEHAMMLVLQDLGINAPKRDILTLMTDFRETGK